MPTDVPYTIASSLAAAAVAYARIGWCVFPLKPGTKNPLLTGGVNDASRDPGRVAKWWTQHPTANIGLALRASGLGVVDVDIKPDKGINGMPLLAELSLLYGDLGTEAVQRSAGGGLHYVFKRDGDRHVDIAHWPAERRDAQKRTGIDVFTARHRYIVASPSVLEDGARYEWLTVLAPWDEVGPLAPEWRQLVRMEHQRVANEHHAGAVDMLDIIALRVPGVGLAELESVLAVLPAEMPRDDWLRVLWGAAAQWAGTKDEKAVVQALEEWSSGTTKPGQYVAGEVMKRWTEHTAGAGGRSGGGHVTWRGVRAVAKEHGWTPFSLAGVTPDNWSSMLDTKKEASKSGEARTIVKPSAWNVAVMLAYHKAFRGGVKRNVLTNAVEMHTSAVCPLRDPTRLPIEFSKESDWAGVGRAMTGKIHGDISRDAICAGVTSAADVHAYDPMKEWVESLSWDGVPRVNGWLRRVTGCKDTPLHQEIGRKWLVGLAGRSTCEYDGRGTKMDSVLILQGGEGIGKSTVGAVLGGEWFAEFSNSINNDDIYYVIERTMVLEFPELDAMSRSEATRVKSLVTTQADTFRRKYAPNAAIKPRRCVFIGTTNDSAFLTRDMTARRWWVVPCANRKFDLPWLRLNREQLIAEAVVLHRNGEVPVLGAAHHADQRASVENVLMEHPYESAVLAWTGQQADDADVDIKTAVEGALARAVVSLTMHELRKFGECMRQAGWQKVKTEEGNRWVRA